MIISPLCLSLNGKKLESSVPVVHKPLDLLRQTHFCYICSKCKVTSAQGTKECFIRYCRQGDNRRWFPNIRWLAKQLLKHNKNGSLNSDLQGSLDTSIHIPYNLPPHGASLAFLVGYKSSAMASGSTESAIER